MDQEFLKGKCTLSNKPVHSFISYWKKPEATKNSFTVGKYKCDDEPERIVNWFVTGDIAGTAVMWNEHAYSILSFLTIECKNNMYQILGRASVDILKSGGYKIRYDG